MELIFTINFYLDRTRKMIDAFNEEGRKLDIRPIVTTVPIKVLIFQL